MNSSNDSESCSLNLQKQPNSSPSNNPTNDANFQDINNLLTLTEANAKAKQRKTSIVRMRFAPQEDSEILRLVSIYGDKDWNKISSELSKNSNNFIQKTPRQCRDRYVNYLSPDIKKGEWTLEEDQCLMYNYVMSIFNLKSLKQLLPGRSEVAIKNRIKHLSKFGIGIIKSTIDKNLQQNDTNEPNLTNLNLSNLFPDPNINSNQILNNFNINFGQFCSNQVRSVVTDIFHNSPLVLPSIKDNHLILNQKTTNKSTDVTTEETNNSNINNNVSDFSQFESENDSFDPTNWIDMYL